MIATGNHDFERFAALCNTPGGSQEEVAGADSIQCTHPFQERWVAKNSNHLQIVYSRNRPADVATIQPLAFGVLFLSISTHLEQRFGGDRINHPTTPATMPERPRNTGFLRL